MNLYAGKENEIISYNFSFKQCQSVALESYIHLLNQILYERHSSVNLSFMFIVD